jgi:putative transposase
MKALRATEPIGRPLGSDSFLDAIAALTGRDARPGRRGRKRKVVGD